jgi:hypothetical protein
MNGSDVIGGSAVPLTEALPWADPPTTGRTYLVNDAMDTDGRFLLYTLTSQVLSSKATRQGRVLWLGFQPVTEEQIVQGLKRIGCDRNVLAMPPIPQHQQQDAISSKTAKLTIRSLWVELSTRMLDEENIDSFSEANFMKEILDYVDQWVLVEGDNVNSWIILDDVSTFSSFVGERLMYHFIITLNARSRSKGFGLMIRCSNDQEDQSLPVYSGASMKGYQDWFGAGGTRSHVSHDEEPPWERALVELADGVMDVLPLTSGYTRELHGRIVLTRMPLGRGWEDDPSTVQNDSGSSSLPTTKNNTPKQYPPAMQIINYCITDQNPKIVAYIM